jgi:death-on-curing family protein
MGRIVRFINPQIEREFDRWKQKIGDEDPYLTGRTLGISDVLEAHFYIADFFASEGSGLGGVGPHDLNLLHSALYRQHICFGDKCKYSDIFDLAATLLFGLVKDHPFQDANKRTAFLSTIYFLQRSGYTPSVSHKEFEDFLVEVADNKIREKSRFQDFEEKYDDPEVQYISWYLRKNSRKIDRRQHIITYRELKKILNRFGFDLKYPNNNHIDVYKFQERKLVFSKKAHLIEKKIGVIGFPGMTKEVPRSVLKKARELCHLTEGYGLDSQVFFNEADTLDLLIAQYREPLKRLADR